MGKPPLFRITFLRGSGFFLLLLVHTALACDPAERNTPPSEVRDSAGVTVVLNDRPLQSIDDLTKAAPLAATVPPIVGEYALGRITDAVILSGGRIAMIDFASRQLILFAPGRGVEIVARNGRGPGEVTFPLNLQRLQADSLQVYDRRLARISVFDSAGSFVRDIRIASSGPPPLAVLRLQDTLFVALERASGQRSVIAQSSSANLGITPVYAALYDHKGEPIDTLAKLHGYADLRTAGSSLAPVYGTSIPFGVTPSGNLVHGSGELPILHVVDGRGQLKAAYQLRSRRVAVRPDSLASILSEDQPRPGMPAPVDLPILLPEFLPDSQPSYKEIRVSEGGNLWLGSAEPFRIPSRTWEVLSRNGAWLARIRLPRKSQLLDVTRGSMLLLRTDSMDAQRLDVYDVRNLDF